MVARMVPGFGLERGRCQVGVNNHHSIVIYIDLSPFAVDGVVDVGGISVPFGESGNNGGLDKFDYSFIYGLGAKFDLFYKDWFFDYRQTIGWNTLNMPTSEGQDPAPLRNQTYSFTLDMYFYSFSFSRLILL